MAKKKAENHAGEPKPAAKKKTTKKAASPASAAPGVPMIDTAAAAAAAAKMIAGGLGSTGAAAGGNKVESSSFKNLKQSLQKPSLGNLGGPVGGIDPKKSNLPFGIGNQQRGGQTFGADVNRTGVPRRTSGG